MPSGACIRLPPIIFSPPARTRFRSRFEPERLDQMGQRVSSHTFNIEGLASISRTRSAKVRDIRMSTVLGASVLNAESTLALVRSARSTSGELLGDLRPGPLRVTGIAIATAASGS